MNNTESQWRKRKKIDTVIWAHISQERYDKERRESFTGAYRFSYACFVERLELTTEWTQQGALPNPTRLPDFLSIATPAEFQRN